MSGGSGGSGLSVAGSVAIPGPGPGPEPEIDADGETGVRRTASIAGGEDSFSRLWDCAIRCMVFALSLLGPRVPWCLLNVQGDPMAMQPVQGVVLEQRTLRTLHASQARFAEDSEEASTDILSGFVLGCGWKGGRLRNEKRRKGAPSIWVDAG